MRHQTLKLIEHYLTLREVLSTDW